MDNSTTSSPAKVLSFDSHRLSPATAKLLAATEHIPAVKSDQAEGSGPELIQVDERLAADLDYVERYSDNDWLTHKVRVRKVAPCASCQRPIVQIKFSHDGQTRDCDAVQGYDKYWRADVLHEHLCSPDCPEGA